MLKTVSSITNAIGALNYKGTWNASTNTPTLADGTGAKGDYYVVSTAGTQTFGGIQLFFGAGDWIVYNGAVWQRVEGGSDGNFANVTLTSTDAGATAAPLLDLYRDSASPAASDTLGEIEFNGEDSAGNKQAYGLIHASILSPTSTAEQGQLHFETATAGALTEKMIIGTTNLVINDIGAVFNVRIEGDTDANLFYTDATNSRIGVGTITPSTKLDVVGTVAISSTTTLSGLTASTALALDASKNIVSVTNTGTGSNVLATAPTLVSDVSLSTGNLSFATTGKGITTSSSIPLGFGTNGSTSQITLSTAGLLTATGAATIYGGSTQISSASTYGASTYAMVLGNGGSSANYTKGDDNYWQLANGSSSMALDSGSNLTISGATATKASGITWANPSDQRLKENICDYSKGTTELMQVRVREWDYNGKGGTTLGMKGLGVIADEVMTVLPDTVEDYYAKLNAEDEETTAIKKFDATEITWLLVKTVQEQQVAIELLTVKLLALENK